MDLSKIDLNKLPVDARKDFMKYAIKLDEKKKEEKVHSDFLTFVKSVCPISIDSLFEIKHENVIFINIHKKPLASEDEIVNGTINMN